MSNKMMLINVTDDETRIAIVEHNLLQDMLIEHRTKEQIKGNIYKGVVDQVQPSVQAAFVDFGNKKHGFLPLSEVNYNLFPPQKGRRNMIQSRLKSGQPVLVQVTKEAVDHKGASLSTFITLPGRFMVLMPDSDKGGVSKKIEDPDERERLKGFLSGIQSEDHAVIIRTAGMGRSLQELKKDYTEIKKTWEEIQQNYNNTKGPGLVQEEDDVVTRALRDYYTDDMQELWVDSPEAYQKALIFLKKNDPRNQKNLKLFVDERSLFSTYNIEKQVEQLTSRDVKLRSGGSIVIEQTEALVAIDVNSGRSRQEGSIDETALRTNMEAAEEVARQLRLRNMGGLIVIDFIDMESDAYRKKVEDRLRQSMELDKAQLKFGPISQFGILELSRQRLAMGIANVIENSCPVCKGKGAIPSLQASTNLILRYIREMAVKGNLYRIEGELPLQVANYLLNDRRQLITDLEHEFDIHITLKGDPDQIVLDEQKIKCYFLDKSKPQPIAEAVSTGDKQRSDSRRPRRQEREPSKPRVEEKEEPVVQETRVEETKTEEPVAKEQEAEKPKEHPRRERAPKKDSRSNRGGQSRDSVRHSGATIHPSCLFQDVQEIPEEELEELNNAFEARLKGLHGETKQIDSKYLWEISSVNKPPTQQAEAKPSSGSRRKKKTEEGEEVIQTDSADDADGSSEEKPVAEAKGRRGATKTGTAAKKPSSRRPSAKKKQTEESNSEEEKKPAKPRGRSKKAIEADDTEQSKAKADAKPKKAPAKRKSPAKAKVAKEEGEETPAKPKARRGRKKKTEPAADSDQPQKPVEVAAEPK